MCGLISPEQDLRKDDIFHHSYFFHSIQYVLNQFKRDTYSERVNHCKSYRNPILPVSYATHTLTSLHSEMFKCLTGFYSSLRGMIAQAFPSLMFIWRKRRLASLNRCGYHEQATFMGQNHALCSSL